MAADPVRRLLIAGCGDLGIRLGARLAGWEIHGLRRNPAGLPPGIVPVCGDLGNRFALEAVAGTWDALVYTATPAERTPAAYREAYVEGLGNLLEKVRTPRLIFVSSTAVYGQDQGEWVDEEAPTRPRAFSGEILLEAEALARAAGGTVLRFSGIYGPGREYLIRQVRAGPVRCRRDPPLWTNRIHADDCAGALAHLLSLEKIAELYCASDAEPAPRWEVLAWLAERLGVPGPVEAVDEKSGQGKRISAKRLFATGLRLQYPDFRAGYRAILEHDTVDRRDR